MYIFSLPVLVLASAGVVTSASIPALLFWRFMQSIGASPGMVLGAGIIGDIYKLEERGRAMGIFFAVCGLMLNP
jgi:MFS family permease